MALTPLYAILFDVRVAPSAPSAGHLLCTVLRQCACARGWQDDEDDVNTTNSASSGPSYAGEGASATALVTHIMRAHRLQSVHNPCDGCTCAVAVLTQVQLESTSHRSAPTGRSRRLRRHSASRGTHMVALATPAAQSHRINLRRRAVPARQ